MTILLWLIGIVYVSTTLLLFAFGINLIRLSVVALRAGAPTGPGHTSHVAALPAVTVQLPIYNELFVAERVIRAAAALDYPRDRLQIQVLDDSTDDTSEVVAAVVSDVASTGVDIVQLRRDDRTGFKAGALSAALPHATGELVAIFDADFVPQPDFLRSVVHEFADDDVAFVQARWDHLNAEESFVTSLQSVAIDGHFLVEQVGRGVRAHWFNFNGTCGVWRVAAIEDAGGWTADTLTEDLDLSYRASLAGWRGVFRSDVVVPGEIPAQMAGFRRQQHRWARGSAECARKLIPTVWRSAAPVGVKTQATLHLGAYGVHALLFVLMLLYPAVVVLVDEVPATKTLFGFAYPLAFASLAPFIFLLSGQHLRGGADRRALGRVVALVVLGAGLMVNTVRAFLTIWTKPDAPFERTPKFGATPGSSGELRRTRRYQLGVDRIVVAEYLLAGYGLATAWFAWSHSTWGVVVFSTMFSLGLLGVATTTVAQGRRLDRLPALDEAVLVAGAGSR